MRRLLTRLLTVATLCVAATAFAGTNPTAETQDMAIRRDLALTAYTVQTLDLPADMPAAFTVRLNLGGQAVEVDLAQFSVRAPGFKVLLDRGVGMIEIPAPPVNTYRGDVAAGGTGTAALSLVDDGIEGYITVGQGAARQSWFVQPLSDAVAGAPRGRVVVYREQDRIQLPGTCGVAPGAAGGVGLEGRMPVGGYTDTPRVCQIACEADYQFFQLNGSNTTATTNDINAVINGVSTIYSNDVNVVFQISAVIIHDTAAGNPYTTNNSQNLLNQMQAYWIQNQGSVVRDIAHMFTGREVDGSVIGIAFLSAVCNAQIGYGLVQSRFTSNFAYRLGLSAHELGHNFSAQHCDGVCNPCYIMCSGLGGCNGVVTTFEPCNKTIITNYAATRGCLTPLPPPVLTLPFVEPFPSISLDPLKWTNNNGVGVSAGAANPPSPPYALLFIQAASVETKQLDTAGPNRPVFASFRYEHTGVEAGEALNVLAFNEFSSAFDLMGSVVSDGVDMTRFVYKEFKLPLTGLSATKGAIKFASTGNDFGDAWYIDDVSVSIYCRADVNKDGALNLADFGAFTTAFALGNASIADFNDDGAMNLADFGAFQTKFALGCY